VTRLDFLSPSRCAPEALASPLRRALAHAPASVRDLSLEGKVELRGDLDRFEPQPGEELVRLSPRRGLLLTEDPLAAVARARSAGVLAYDVSGGLAGLALEGERLLGRLTHLDLERLPAAGPFAHVAAILLRDEGERFRVYLPQELAHDVAEAVLDTLAGLEAEGDA
jgi:sarcosine oxidase gamma subunit